MGKTVSAFFQSSLIGSLSNLQVMRTGIKSWMSQTFRYGVIRPWAFPLTLNGENGVSIFSQLLWIQSSSNLQVTRTGIKSQMSWNFGRIWPVILELRALERWKKWCLQFFSVTFDWIFVKLVGNEDRHKSSSELEVGPDRIIYFGVICLERGIFFPYTYNGENNVFTFYQLLLIQSSSNLQVTKTGMKCWTGFEFWPDLTSHFGVTCPWVVKNMYL